MKELHNFAFRMCMRGGYKNDVWALCGNSSELNGEFVFVSTPVDLVEIHDGHVVTTYSGSQYLLVNPDGDLEKIIQEIRDVIERGGYTKH